MGVVAMMSGFVPSSSSPQTPNGVALEKGQKILQGRHKQLQKEVDDIDNQIEVLRAKRRGLREKQRQIASAMYSIDQEIKSIESN